MELFNTDGHLTNEGLHAVIAENLPELQRLEAAEHLSFCDECLLNYSLLLEDEILYTPSEPILQPIKKRLRQKFIHFTLSKYTTVAAAVAFMVTLYATGVFTTQMPTANSILDVKPSTNFTQSENNILSSVTDAFKEIFNKSKPIEPPKEHKLTPPEIKVPKQPEIKVPKQPEIKVPKQPEIKVPKPFDAKAQNEADEILPPENLAKKKLQQANPAQQSITAENPAQSKLNSKREK